ncbi:MAG TPA: hypothetical protein VF297_09135 [Pyrinomonadaceae bacterium]
MSKRVPGPTPSTPARRRAWLWFVVGAALLSVVFTQAQERKPASTGDETKPREESRSSATGVRRPGENVNGLPFVELAEKSRMLVETGRLGFDTALDMSATAELNEDGSFKPETVKIDWRAGDDEEVRSLARHLLTAISESKLLAVLDGAAKAVRLTARLDRENLALGLEAELVSEAEASKWATGYGTLMLMARKAKEGTDEGRLYEALKVASEGRVVKVAFEMPKVFAAKMVAEMLDKRAARGATPNQD